MKNSLKVLLLACTSLMALDSRAAVAERLKAEAETARAAHAAALADGGFDGALVAAVDAEFAAHGIAVRVAPSEKIADITAIAVAYRAETDAITTGAGGAAALVADVRTRLNTALAATNAAALAEIAAKDAILAGTRAALPAAVVPVGDAAIPTQVAALATLDAAKAAILDEATRDLGTAGFAPAAHADIPARIRDLTTDRDRERAAVATAGDTATAAIDAALAPLFPAAAIPATAAEKVTAIVDRENEIVDHVNTALDTAVGTLPEAIDAVVAATNALRPGLEAVTNIGEVMQVLFRDINTAVDALVRAGVIGAPADGSITAGVTAVINDRAARIVERDEARRNLRTAETTLGDVDADLVAALTPAAGVAGGGAPALGDPLARVAELVAARATAETAATARAGERDALTGVLGTVETTLTDAGAHGTSIVLKAADLARIAHDRAAEIARQSATITERNTEIEAVNIAFNNIADLHHLAAVPAGTIEARATAVTGRLVAAERDLDTARTELAAVRTTLDALSGIVNPVFAGGVHAGDALVTKLTLLANFGTAARAATTNEEKRAAVNHWHETNPRPAGGAV